jgi:hypothetical protein
MRIQASKLSKGELEKALEVIEEVRENAEKLHSNKRGFFERVLKGKGIELPDVLHNLYHQRMWSSIRVAKLFGVDDYTVCKWLRRYHIKVRRKDQVLIRKDVPVGRLLEEYLAPNQPSIAKLARKYGCSSSVIRHRLIKAGIKIRTNQPTHSWAHITIRPGISAMKGYIIMALFGDGKCTLDPTAKKHKQYKVGIKAREEDFVKFFAKCMKDEYNLEPIIYREQNTWVAIRGCKPVWEDIMHYAILGKYQWTLTEKGMGEFEKLLPKELGFALSGFFDAEGHVDHVSVRASSVNRKGLELVKYFLSKLGINSKVRGPYNNAGSPIYVLYIAVPSLENFRKLVGFNIAQKRRRLEKLTP